MDNKYRILGLTILLGLLLVLVEAIANHFLLPNVHVAIPLFGNVPVSEIFVSLLLFFSFCVFGVISARLFYKVEQEAASKKEASFFLQQLTRTGGFRPASRVHFLCIDKENATKRKRPQYPHPLRGNLRSAAISGPKKFASLRLFGEPHEISAKRRWRHEGEKVKNKSTNQNRD
jgi:hypothetical protein